ncbi:MAG: hypothetical protein C0500_03600 [Sphingobium sp.]|nr:hypothetical protein [Sphingobium sp.]
MAKPLAASALLVLSLAGCASVERAAAPASAPPSSVSFLAFGDSGYSLDYLDPEDLNPPLTREQFIAKARASWIKDKRPIAEFTPPPMVADPSNGGFVAASGLMPVAKAMTDYCRNSARCQFGVMLGDNIYPDGATLGADGRDDAKRFQDLFATPYGAFGWGDADFRIYATLGNHDWHTSREGALAQVRYLSETRPFYMDGLAYAAQPPAAKGMVEIFSIDTHVLLAGEKVLDGKLADDGSEVPTTKFDASEPWATPATDAERAMVANLEQRLKASKARWKIVIGHHPLWSSSGGKFEQARTLRAVLLPTLCRYADLYLAGHEHTLEVATDSCATAAPGEGLAALPNIVSGAAAKQRPLNTAFMAHQLRTYPQYRPLYVRGMIWGFAHLTLTDSEAKVTMVSTPNDGNGQPKVEFTQIFTRRNRVGK